MTGMRPMPADTTETSAGTGRQHSRRALSARRAVLDAASVEFVEKGYEAATIAGLVERSGVSVGSIYHHFGGKAEVFGALYDEYYLRQRRLTEEGNARAREAGEADLLRIYLAGARAYLQGCWHDRALTRLFHAREGSPGMWQRRQDRVMEWVRTNTQALGGATQPHGDSLAHAVTALVAAAALELTEIETATDAEDRIDYFLGLIERIAAP